MLFSGQQRGFDEQGRRIRHIAEAIENADPLLQLLAFDLAKMWQDNIDAGPNERWQAGPSRRVQKFGGVTLRDRGFMKASIAGAQTAADAVTVGSAMTVGKRGWNLLSLHELGVDTTVQVQGFNRLSRRQRRFTVGTANEKLKGSFGSFSYVRPFTRHQFLPKRPTSPFNFDTGEMTPAADTLIRSRVGDYLVELAA
jgi:hypothetical protein